MCVCITYLSEDLHMTTPRHTKDCTPSKDPNTGPRKTLAKNAENVMFYHLRGVSTPRTSMDFKNYYIYEDTRVLRSISNSQGVWGCVCVCAVVGGAGCVGRCQLWNGLWWNCSIQNSFYLRQSMWNRQVCISTMFVFQFLVLEQNVLFPLPATTCIRSLYLYKCRCTSIWGLG